SSRVTGCSRQWFWQEGGPAEVTMSGAYYEHPDVVRSDAPDLQGFSIRTSREALPRAEALARSLLVECAKAGFHVESLAEGEARKESWTAARLILVMGVGYSFDLYEL